jgi:hypothetical protein
MELNLFFYGISVRVLAADSAYFGVLKDLEEDFSYFQSVSDIKNPHITIELKFPVSSQFREKGLFFFKNAAASVYGWWGSERMIDYGGEARIHLSKSSEKKGRFFEVSCSKLEDTRELAYLTILSAVGEMLDLKNFHRVHALGIQKDGFAGIISLPSGHGKTSMAALLSEDERFRIFSDETPLILGGDLYAYPVRMAIHPEVAQALGLPRSDRVFKRRLYPAKALYPIPVERVAEKAGISFVVVGGEPSATVPGIRRCSKIKVFIYLLESMVVGAGIAQIAEHMIRLDSVFSLIRIAFSRLFTSFRVTLQSRCYVFDLSRDAKKNSAILADFLNTQGRSTS